MRTTIDKAGRVVIPRAIRERIGLHGGGEVEIELDGAAIRLEPVGGTQLTREGRFLVIPADGEPLRADEVQAMIDDDRHRPA